MLANILITIHHQTQFTMVCLYEASSVIVVVVVYVAEVVVETVVRGYGLRDIKNEVKIYGLNLTQREIHKSLDKKRGYVIQLLNRLFH